MAIISMANQTLTTPALRDITRRFPEKIPQDVCRYIDEIFERNLIRNDRLSAQLTEAVGALNEKGITPLLLKGSAMLTMGHRCQMGRRLLSDLDIFISPEQTERAIDCLFDIGYRVHFQTPDGASKSYADLGRPGDAGMIDLQESPPGHGFFYSVSGDVKQHCQLFSWKGVSAYIPSATYHALTLIIHDQFQDSDYWVGKIDLRHLLDLRDLANSSGGIDWKLLASLAPGKLARNAIETQLIALFSLLDVDVPADMRIRFIPRVQHQRRMLQIRMPALSHALLTIALLDYRNYRAEVGALEKTIGRLRRKRILPRIATARFLLNLSQEQRAGKV